MRLLSKSGPHSNPETFEPEVHLTIAVPLEPIRDDMTLGETMDKLMKLGNQLLTILEEK